jgi:deoxyribodipyrimidine photolyase-related protein
MNNVYVVLGNQLFEPNLLINLGCEHVFMSEDFQLCRYEKAPQAQTLLIPNCNA